MWQISESSRHMNVDKCRTLSRWSILPSCVAAADHSDHAGSTATSARIPVREVDDGPIKAPVILPTPVATLATDINPLAFEVLAASNYRCLLHWDSIMRVAS